MAYRRPESRPLDHRYDTVFTKPGFSGAATLPYDAKAASGTGRYKFFHRPMVPQMDPVAPGVLLAPAVVAPHEDLLADGPETMGFEEERTRDVGAQTAYRESEAQTEAYSPDYVLAPGKPAADVLMLAGLSQAAGTLPCGEREVMMIEHAQQKRRLEESLPPATDEASLALRRRLLEIQEMREFALRQREVDEAHAERLELLKRAIAERDADADYVAEQRVEALRQRRIDERDAGLEAIQASRIKVLRKLAMARGRLQPPQSAPPYATAKSQTVQGGRDIIAEYATYSSRVYAPILRDGQRPDGDAASSKFDVACVVPALATTAGVVDAVEDAALKPRLTRARVGLPDDALTDKTQRRTAQERHHLQVTADLEKMAALIDDRAAAAAHHHHRHHHHHHHHQEAPPSRGGGGTRPSTTTTAVGATQATHLAAGRTVDASSDPPPTTTNNNNNNNNNTNAEASTACPAWRAGQLTAERPPTPHCAPWDEAADELEQALRFVQRALRGRAVQADMFNGKERRIELIRELRAADEARDAEGIHPPTMATVLLDENNGGPSPPPSQGDNPLRLLGDGAHGGGALDPAALDAAVFAAEVRRAAVAEAALEAVAGEAVAATLDALAKEKARRALHAEQHGEPSTPGPAHTDADHHPAEEDQDSADDGYPPAQAPAPGPAAAPAARPPTSNDNPPAPDEATMETVIAPHRDAFVHDFVANFLDKVPPPEATPPPPHGAAAPAPA